MYGKCDVDMIEREDMAEDKNHQRNTIFVSVYHFSSAFR